MGVLDGRVVLVTGAGCGIGRAHGLCAMAIAQRDGGVAEVRS